MRPAAVPRRSSALAALGASLAIVLAAPAAQGQLARDPAAAGSAFARGKQAMKRGDLDAACNLFGESVRLDPAPGARLNLADCDEARGRLASARQEFEDALADLPAGDDRIGFARERIARLGPRVPTLALTLTGEPIGDVEVLRDGRRLANPTIGEPVPLDPGEHEIRVRAPGRRDAVQRVSLVAGERRSLALVPGEREPVGPPLAAERRRTSPLVYGAIVGGGAALVAGTVLGILTLNRASTVDEHCTPRCDATGYSAGEDGRWMSIASPVALGVRAALVGVGLYVLLRRPATTRLASW